MGKTKRCHSTSTEYILQDLTVEGRSTEDPGENKPFLKPEAFCGWIASNKTGLKHKKKARSPEIHPLQPCSY